MSTTTTQRVIGGIVLASAGLIASVASLEGTETVPYKDIVGVQTVCSGHTGPDIKPGKIYTAQECNRLLVQDLSKHGQGVLQCTKVPLNQNQYDAFVSFAYNVGVSAYCQSTLVKKLNNGDYTAACNELTRWVYAGGKRVKGLVLRREKEKALCLKPVSPVQKELS